AAGGGGGAAGLPGGDGHVHGRGEELAHPRGLCHLRLPHQGFWLQADVRPGVHGHHPL
ncbi:unnamed protein product, partial [Heterosigma akashiwo]